jgi:hypothetical protein
MSFEHCTKFLLRKFPILLLSISAVISFLMFAGCINSESTSIKTPCFPVQKEVQKNTLDGLFEGELVLDNGYLRSLDIITGNDPLILWPYGYSIETNGNQIQILNDKDQPVAAIGDYIKVGGGEIPRDWAEELIGQTLPDGFDYWMASSVEFFPHFPIYTNITEPGQQDNNTIEGILVLENSNRYLRLQVASGESYFPIWPPRYYLIKKSDQFLVMGSKWQPHPGDNVIVRGFAANSETLKKYIFYTITDDWKGPYWIVTTIEEDSNTKN